MHILDEEYPGLVYPSFHLARLNSTVRFMCDSLSVTKWTFDGNPLPNNAKISGKARRIITITGIDQTNIGKYQCHYIELEISQISHGSIILGELN